MYCNECGTKLDRKEIGNEGFLPFCESCSKVFFPKVNLAIIAIITNKTGQICLINQINKPKYKVLVAGYIKPPETLEECAIREIKEEVGLEVFECNYLNSHYYNDNNVLMVAFHVKTNQTEITIDLSELDNADWYDKDDCLHRIREGSIAYNLVKQYLKEI